MLYGADFLPKPFGLDQLATRVAAVLARVQGEPGNAKRFT